MVTPQQAIDTIQSVYGSHPGHRALHAKGQFFSGTFTATPAAAALSRAGHLQGAPVPVWVRWSDGSGSPTTRDDRPDVRGMAVSFRLPDGTATDILGQTGPRFPVRTPEDFLALVRAAGQAWRMPVFMATHPQSVAPLLANIKAGALKPPRSFAEATYYAIHAYRWLGADGSQRWVRYTLVPHAERGTTQRGSGPDFLHTEIAARIENGPVRYTLQVQVAGDGDDPHDPMSVWSSTERIDAGTIDITAPDPEREGEGRIVVFDPTRVVDGIELSDDPILHYRPKAYGESVNRRV